MIRLIGLKEVYKETKKLSCPTPAESPQDDGDQDRSNTSCSSLNRTFIRGQNIPVDSTELAERERRRQKKERNDGKKKKQKRIKEEQEEELLIEREQEIERQRKEGELRTVREKMKESEDG
ncbi:hypothetical protein BDFB_008267 [Asbolus verrucosus]|uniref:CCDC66 domain-containing protein n=1 Tax=Asbolus verrucosus TaxID=1661398 RepID=A0A482V7F2_ASBVE|nr:hypothetical protein BDFB_008267 [Asbolus verrucosus]